METRHEFSTCGRSLISQTSSSKYWQWGRRAKAKKPQTTQTKKPQTLTFLQAFVAFRYKVAGSDIRLCALLKRWDFIWFHDSRKKRGILNWIDTDTWVLTQVNEVMYNIVFQSEIQRTTALNKVGPKFHPFHYSPGVSSQVWCCRANLGADTGKTMPIANYYYKKSEENPSAKNAQDSKDISWACFGTLSIYLKETII